MSPRRSGSVSTPQHTAIPRRLWLWVAGTIAFALLLGRAPLFDVLGYELAVATALFAALAGADIGRAYARMLQARPPRPGWPGATLARSTVRASLIAVAILLIPGVIAAIRGLWRPTCDWTFGITAYLALPVVTAALAGAAGHLAGILVPRRYLGALVAQLPFLLVAALALYRFYAAPAVFTYNAILGYFPGNLYDENVRLEAPLLWSRLEQVAWLVAAIALVATRLDVPSMRARWSPRPTTRHRRQPLILAALALAAAITLRWQGGRLGYAIDADDVADALGGRLETAHFIIHYAPTPEILADLPLIAADHEFRYAQVVAETGGVAPEGKLTSFYFADRDQKSKLMGARDVEMAKPWRHEIYLDHRSFPHPSLRHEIAHSVASAFGDPWFGVAAGRVLGLPVKWSPGLIEGLAVALDWPGGYDRPNPHESVRAMQELKALPSLDTLFGLGFFSVSSQRGYTTAGSFLRFLLDTYGPEKLRAVYHSGGDFAAAYGVPRDTLEAQWKAMIATIPMAKTVAAASAERFRGESVFDRPCPHAIAAQHDAAMAALGKGDRKRALQILGDVCSQAPGEPRYLMDLGDVFAGGTEAERAIAESLWFRLAADATHVTSSLRADAYERLAHFYGARRDLPHLQAVVAAGVALPLEPSERRTLEGMAYTLAHIGAAHDALFDYFFPGPDSPDGLTSALLAAELEPTCGLCSYLTGLQYVNRNQWAAAAAYLDGALAAGLPGESFTKNAARRLALAAYRAQDATRLGHAIATLAGPTMASGDQLLAKDWQERIEFDRLHPAQK